MFRTPQPSSVHDHIAPRSESQLYNITHTELVSERDTSSRHCIASDNVPARSHVVPFPSHFEHCSPSIHSVCRAMFLGARSGPSPIEVTLIRPQGTPERLQRDRTHAALDHPERDIVQARQRSRPIPACAAPEDLRGRCSTGPDDGIEVARPRLLRPDELFACITCAMSGEARWESEQDAPPIIWEYWSEVRFASGSKVYAYCQVLKGSHQLLLNTRQCQNV